MREILFRGKRKCDGRWVEGYYVQKENPFTEDGMPIKHLIFEFAPFAEDVDPETLSQYIGLKDSKGTKIFDGDIVLSDDLVYGEGGLFQIQWNEEWHGWDANRVGAKDDIYTIWELGDMEIVGNRWDTPNLLGGETQEGPDR